MVENEIYCYVNGFLKWNISKKTGYIVGTKKFLGTKGGRWSQRKRARL